jgi:flagellar protein FlaG
MMLITAVVACAILITAVFPIVWTMVSTFSTASHDTDARMRTDFKIVTWFTHGNPIPLNVAGLSTIWMKNIGSVPIGIGEIDKSDVYIGPVGNFGRAVFVSPGVRTTPADPNPLKPSLSDNQWYYNLYDDNDNRYWDVGETLEINAARQDLISSGPAPYSPKSVYFQFVLPNGVLRSTEFPTSVV